MIIISNNRVIMKIIKINLFIIILFSGLISAQKSEIDTIIDKLDSKNPGRLIIELINKTKTLSDSSNILKLNILKHAEEIASSNKLTSLLAEAGYHKGIIYYRLSRFTESKNTYLGVKKIFQSLDDSLGLRKTYEELGYCYERLGDHDSARVNHEKDLELSIELHNDSTLAIAYTNLGHVEWRKGNFSLALDNFLKALELREKLGIKDRIAASLNSIGSVYWKRGNYSKALEYFFRSTKIREELKDTLGLTISINNIGIVLQKLHYFDKAEEYFEEALGKSDTAGFKFGKSYSYYNLGLLAIDRKNFNEAISMFTKSLEISQVIADLNLLVMTKINLGECYENLDELETARYYFVNSRNEALKYADEFALAKANNCIARVFFKLGKSFNEIIIPLSDSYKLSLEENLREIKKENYELFYKLYSREGKIEEAFNYYKKYTEVKESILNETLLNNITNMIVKFEMQKTETENTLLRKEKQLQLAELESQRVFRNYIIVIVILILFLVVLLVFIIRNKTKTNQQIASQKAEVESLNIELAEINQELRESNKSKDKLFSIISHDLRNPAGVLVNYCQFLDDEKDSLNPESLSAITLSIRKSSESILELVNNLLDWSRSQLGKIIVNPEKVSVKSIFNHVNLIYNNYAQLKLITLKTTIETDIHISADTQMIDSVIRNLVSNALKFTPSGGTITLGAEIRNKMCVISVSDTGVGMTEDVLKSLFLNEYTSSQKGTRNESGTGLGLLLSKEFIKLNGGEIGVESEYGKGSRFWFSLPLY